jgi:fructokinase
MNDDRRPVAAVEGGGTKFRVAVAVDRDILADTTVPTTTPDETLDACVEFIRSSGYEVRAAGVACFGPVDLDRGSPTFGSITATTKPGWSNVDIKTRLETMLGVPVGFDVDVGGAALGEWRWGAARGLGSFVYLTVGTGIGGGAFVNGQIYHGLGHPEMGHVPVRPESDDPYQGCCPFHGSCFEGMACGPAVEERWGDRPQDLVDRDEVWDLEARYLAQGLRTFTYALAPERILLGGGLMQRKGLLELVRTYLAAELGGYTTSSHLRGDLTGYVVSPELGQDAGLYGAIALAHQIHGGKPGGNYRTG